MTDEISESLRRRTENYASAADTLRGMFSVGEGATGRQLTDNQRAWIAWTNANGDVERAHTAGVHLAPPRGKKTLPTLVVYTDTRARATDFSANREVYQARLEAVGFVVDSVIFRQTRYPMAPRASAGAEGPKKEPTRLPELTAVEMEEVQDACESLPERIRAKVRAAMAAAIRRQKLEDAEKSHE